MELFEELLRQYQGAVERFVRYQIRSDADAEDVLQEVYLTAYQKFSQLQDPGAFRAWLLRIARNKCTDYYRAQAKTLSIPIDLLSESVLSTGSSGRVEQIVVSETLQKLRDRDRQILYLYYFKELPQEKIAKHLQIPIGTVKSRLYHAKERFKKSYPYPPDQGGKNRMKQLPKCLPHYRIEPVKEAPFAVRHEELPGMLIIPKLGEKLSFGMYDAPKNQLTGSYQLEVTNDVTLHGVHGVEIQSHYTGVNEPDEESVIFAQLTDQFCRYLGGMFRNADGKRNLITFLDDAFEDAYSIGENNRGFPVARRAQNNIILQGDNLAVNTEEDVSDLVGRYLVTIGEKTYDTVRLVNLEHSGENHMMSEYYLDQKGRTILWRRFNHENWAYPRYGKKWTELLPENETLRINDQTYVHWYDCITDYIL